MPATPDLPFAPDADLAAVREALALAGWDEVGRGDWCWVHARPESRIVLRITPFDPAYRIYAEHVLAGLPNHYLPRVEALVPLAGEAYAVVMERLWPADPDVVAAFCRRIGIPSDSGYVPPPFIGDAPGDPELDRLRARLEAMLAEGRRRIAGPFWGGADLHPGNVMADAQGAPKLIDPIFLSGPRLLEAIRQERPEVAASFSPAQLRAFLTIPVFQPGPETDALAASMERLLAAA